MFGKDFMGSYASPLILWEATLPQFYFIKKFYYNISSKKNKGNFASLKIRKKDCVMRADALITPRSIYEN